MQNPPVGKDIVPCGRVITPRLGGWRTMTSQGHICTRVPHSSHPRRVRGSFTFLVPGFHGHAKVPGLDLTLVYRNR